MPCPLALLQPRLASRAKARRFHRCGLALRAMHCAWRQRRTGRFRCWPCGRLTTFQVVVWSGIRTRDYRIRNSMLYPTELSSGETSGIRTRVVGLRRCSTSEPSLPSRNTASRSSAYATARPRAPGGTHEPAPLRKVRRCFVLAPASKRQFICEFIRTARAEACRHSALGASSGSLSSDQQMSAGFRARCTRVDSAPFANAKNKTPPDVESEGVRVPRRSG